MYPSKDGIALNAAICESELAQVAPEGILGVVYVIVVGADGELGEAVEYPVSKQVPAWIPPAPRTPNGSVEVLAMTIPVS